MNGIDEGIASDILKFADDTKLFTAISESQDIMNLKASLKQLEMWFSNWKMPVNTKKCGVLKFSVLHDPNVNTSYHLFHQELSQKNQEKDLGVYISTELNYKELIRIIVNKALQVYGWMVRTLVSIDKILIIREVSQ